MRTKLLIPVVMLPLFTGCASAQKVARHEARAAVLLVADAVKEADETCAALAEGREDRPMALECAKQYDAARSHLINVSKSIDAFDSGKARDILCGTIAAADEVQAIASIITKGGGHVPPAVQDALEYAKKLGGCR